ncbi:bifunctional DNA primase/polymerase [Streptomyces neyagawaensis]|uniref:bifunctional DNA primase/polymerase n=2 Tax=Streptomyces neyagawaensis TaxID=42238 RepID=UPI00201D2324|nr:bifunctional DNA primase/polymerase [Streptomyces neyagawaensis]MCL6738588.1 bifunctional DNA primase/polymerase [Streptomyces neyagawaensis]MDE1681863.1 bifunctional DNA primase/polymerase [Streptomyces neyagawaensis]
MTHDARHVLLRAALDAAERGWHVFPLRPHTKRPALHGESACPRTGPCATGHRKWEQRATTDPDLIRATWARAPYNVGIATGPSGLVVVDLDMPKGKGSSDAPSGATTFAALCERTGQPVPTTRRTRTASGGEHLYFTAPAGARLGNTAGTLAPLVDTRAWGGYVVGAGSTTPAGPYETVGGSGVAELPTWLVRLLQPAPVRSVGPLRLPAVSGSRAALAALERECATVGTAPDRQRNITLNRSAFLVGRFVAWGDIPRHVVEEAFQAAGEARGLTAAECRATIRSALDSSIRKARPREAA